MNNQIQPYFMENEEWWFYDWEEMKYKLTEKAPKEAIESYEEFYKEIKMDEDEYDGLIDEEVF